MSDKPTYEELEQRVKELENGTFDRKQVEKQSQLEHSRLMGILESIPDGVYIVDQHFDIEYINPVIERDFGKILGRKCYQYFHNRTESCPWCKNEEVFAGRSVSWEWYSVKNDRHYDLFDTPFENSDGSISKFEIFHDTTELKRAEEALRESEERFRTVADFAYDWEYWIAPDGHHIYVSPSCERITGYSSEEFLNDHELLQKIVHPDDQSTFVRHLRQAKQKEKTSSLDFRIITRRGEERWISHACQPVHGPDGRYLGQRGSNRDISKRKLMQEELLKTKKLESLGVLTGGIAHDFNNMLTVVLGNISLARMMSETYDIEETIKLLIEVEKAAMRTKDLTARLITFSKGGGPVREEVSIRALLKESVNDALRGSGIGCELYIPADVWPVEIDESQMRQVIHNIVTNSMEAMPGRGAIKVYCQNIDISEKDGLALKHGKYVKVSLKDQGAGIPQENLSKVFDPYFSTKEMGTQKGMGLGLAVAYSVVKKHGGLITIESQLGAGTNIHIYLPALSANRDQVEREEVDEQSTIINRQSSIQRVLVMDDEEMVRNVSSGMLSKLGYEGKVAMDGAEAIKMYKGAMESGKAYDVVILDLTNKFGMGGVEAIKRLLEIDPQIRAIVSIGYSHDPILTHFREHGFCGSLSKPFGMDELKTALREVIAGE